MTSEPEAPTPSQGGSEPEVPATPEQGLWFPVGGAVVTRLESTAGGSFTGWVERITGGEGAASWSIIAKHLEATPDRPHWDREAFVYADRTWLDRILPEGLLAPRLLATHRETASATLILEDLGPTCGPPTLDAALLLARFNGTVSAPTPWWSNDFLAQEFALLADRPERLETPSSDSRITELKTILGQLLRRAPRLLNDIATLPHGPAHLDAYSRNLIDADATGRIGLIDWASAGSAPIGTDPATLFALGLAYLDLDAADITVIEGDIVEAMLRGLADVDAPVSPTDAKRTFHAVSRLRFLAMMMNALPMVERRDAAVADITGHPLDVIIDRWIAIGDHLLTT